MAGTKKSPIFRVTGLPVDRPDDALKVGLKAAIDGNLSEEERSKILVTMAIVPSCYDNEREKVALLEFRGEFPNFLSELKTNPLGDWQVEMGDIDIRQRRL
jgi:hypothetical protein